MKIKSPVKIALIGIGKVAQARMNALAEMNSFELAALVSRRSGIGDKSFETVLEDESIEAVAISTENSTHSYFVRKALEAGKHVLCDYPLCFSAKDALELFELARARNKVLQVEHIALLTNAHQQLKRKISFLGKLVRGEFIFQAHWSSSLADVSKQGRFPFLAESRLIQLADLFGEFEVIQSEWYANEKEAMIEFLLQFKKGGEILFTEKRAENFKRERFFKAEFEKGKAGWPDLKEARGLFKKDLEVFHERITNALPCYYDETLNVKILAILEQVSSKNTLSV